ncbi:hypothetical protein CAEBREN_13648 [Caenorhabditis brenneri]|uniref:Uncharacterized protein n=1 Tax=Caenorhabditis brenneri TaxID=135651 RepID=G0N4H2_CAEBE|nr:hypothetical protein CAEBREN_13648 [Caenorhabditis brenneri]
MKPTTKKSKSNRRAAMKSSCSVKNPRDRRGLSKKADDRVNSDRFSEEIKTTIDDGVKRFEARMDKYFKNESTSSVVNDAQKGNGKQKKNLHKSKNVREKYFTQTSFALGTQQLDGKLKENSSVQNNVKEAGKEKV